MKNQTVLSLCIADVEELLTKALREHVLQVTNYEVESVSWVERDNMFRITLQPRPEQVPVTLKA